MSQSVAEALVDVLERVGVKQVFGLIGDSLNPRGCDKAQLDRVDRCST
jgi:pyruvate dehydrogenase (quinone)